jgi:uncharacterized protein YjgD (DUF1641 family)
MPSVEYSNGTSAALDAATIDGLKRLASRSDEIVALLDMVGAGLRRGPEIADNINGLVQIARDAAGGATTGRAAELSSALGRLRALVESDSFRAIETSLQDPKTGASLVKVIERAPDLVSLIDILDRFIQRGPEFADNVNSLVGIGRGLKMPLNLPDFLEALGKLDYVGLVELTRTLYPILASPQVQTLLTRTNILSEETLALVNAAAASALDAQKQETKLDAKAGALGALRGLNDPDVQRTVAFGLDFAKRFGQTLRSGPSLPEPH